MPMPLGPRTDLTGKRFGRLIVTKLLERVRPGRWLWECQCDCGNKHKTDGQSLKSGGSKSCGCYVDEVRAEFMEKNKLDLTGQRFHRFVVVGPAFKRGRRQYWECLCDCGTVKSVLTHNLRNETTKSCGCLNIDLTKARIGEKNHNYNRDLSMEERMERRDLQQNKDWSRVIIQNSKYTCIKCGKTGGKLVAHHLDGWHWAKQGRFDLNNGVCMCRKCHLLFHRTYGFKNNTKTQFKNFVTR